MSSPEDEGLPLYEPPIASGRLAHFLVEGAGTPSERRYPFFDRIEIGRLHKGQTGAAGRLLVRDVGVSSHHCVIRRDDDGRCYVRDISRNGTRLDGRRLVPNAEVEIRPGQVLQLGLAQSFVLAVEAADRPDAPDPMSVTSTRAMSGLSMVTVLVGDIRGYTRMVRTCPSADLQRSVRTLFHLLEGEVERCGGTLKEYQGDAVFAFWEKGDGVEYVRAACRTALRLDRLVQTLAGDPQVWTVRGSALQMDWALATGPVVIDTLGGDRPAGLSMIGEPVVLAYRSEKLADDATGRILACQITEELARGCFAFRSLGEQTAQGFDKPRRIYALLGERPS